MKINETTFRRILQEESKRVLSESIMLVEDDGPFEPGDQVTMQRRGRPPEAGRVAKRRKVGGLGRPDGSPSEDKYVYDVAFSTAGGKMGSRLEQMVPGTALKRAASFNPSPSGGVKDLKSSDARNMSRFNMHDPESMDNYANTIDDIRNEIDDGKDVEIILDPFAASVMALYSKTRESGANRFVLTSQSMVTLVQISSAMQKAAEHVENGSPAVKMYRRAMNEQFLELGIASLVVALIGLLLTFSKGENDSRRQARNQSKMLDIAQYSVENSCEVEVEINSSASAAADSAAEGGDSFDRSYEDSETGSRGSSSMGIKGTGSNKGNVQNSASGKMKITQCRKA